MSADPATAGHDADILYVSGLVAAIFRSPTWVMPISAFVDENCGSFEDQEENKLEYTVIHNAFKQLVDDLLEAHLQELSVTEEQFARFCGHGLQGDNEFHRELVEQLLSVDDFLVFKAMLVKRNAQLYRQALDMFGFHTEFSSSLDFMGVEAAGALDLVGQPFACQYDAGVAQEEAQELDARRRLEASELEAERLDLQRKCVEAELQLAMALSMQLKKRLQLMEALSEVLESLAEMREGAEQALAAEAGMQGVLQVQPFYAVTTAAVEEEAEAAEAALQRERAERAVAVSRQTAAAKEAEATAEREAALRATAAPQQPTEEERQRRAEHLKRQRDLLVQKKQREREQQLSAHQQAHGPTAAARVAEEALVRPRPAEPAAAGQRLAAELRGEPAAPASEPGPSQESAAAEMRRMLTRQLKQTLTSSMRGS